MGKIILNWTYDSDMLECPEYISNNLADYQIKFDAWVSDKNREQPSFWVKYVVNGITYEGVSFGSEDFVEWLKQYVIQPGEEVFFIKREFTPDCDELKLPHINF